MNVNKLLAPVLGALVVVVISSGRATALENPKSCNEIVLRGGTVDGDYVIEPAPGVVFTVYCKDLSSGIRRTTSRSAKPVATSISPRRRVVAVTRARTCEPRSQRSESTPNLSWSTSRI